MSLWFARGFVSVVSLVVVLVASLAPAEAQKGKLIDKAKNMALVGFHNLQARSAYQPIVHRQGSRWIAYVGHHGGSAFNPLTGVDEPNGTSVIDVTDPEHPIYLKHIPGPAGVGEAGGAQMVRVCNGSDLPAANPTRVYLLRPRGNDAHEIYDVTDPAAPSLLTTIVDGLGGTHKNWWECDTGIAYLVSGVPGWRTNRMTQIFDLSNPASPVHIRDYGLVGQEPGSSGPVPTSLHGGISIGQRVYFGHGTNAGGILQIVDRTKLLTGDPAPTPANLEFPIIAQFSTSSLVGAHTTFPVLGIPVPGDEFTVGSVRDIVVLVNESLRNECIGEAHQMVFLVDVTVESTPQVISNFHVPESPGNFCQKGGRFGAHSSNENMTPIYYGRLVFIAYFNAGVRAVDIRDPFNPQEVGYFIPATTSDTDERCVTVGGVETCKVAIQTNNVDVDDRGYVYIVDRANTGMHVLKVTGKARDIANFP
jgi:hypothetical protein